MNINKLIERLTEIRNENAARWPERNELDMVIVVEPPVRKKGQHRRNAKYFRLQYASSAMHGLPVNSPDFAARNALCLVTSAEKEIVPDAGFPGAPAQPNSVNP